MWKNQKFLIKLQQIIKYLDRTQRDLSNALQTCTPTHSDFFQTEFYELNEPP